MKGYNLGNPIYWDDNFKEWRLIETDEICDSDVYSNLICPKCKMKPTSEGHDPCIKNLQGVKYACCGHGVDYGYKHAYIKFEDDSSLRFETTDMLLEYVKLNL
tara:strand:+ start:175 stop:483 length:309 start_codon:yes stop_codon:yes gene_type:complete